MNYKQSLQHELSHLADLMEGCDYGDEYYVEYETEYKRISKILFPEL